MSAGKFNIPRLRELLEVANRLGCRITEDDVLNAPSREELEKRQAAEIAKAKEQGLTIVDAELSKELIDEALTPG